MINNIIKNNPFVYIVFLIIFLIPFPARAEIQIFKITDGIIYSAAGSTGNGRVIYSTNIPLVYKSGKVILSRNPDGTGSISVGDGFQVINQWSSNLSFFTYTYTRHIGCITFKPDPDPIDITSLFGQ